MRWLLALMLVAGVAEGQWPTATPTRTPRPTQPPAPTRTVAPAPTAVAATQTPTPRSTVAPTPAPHAGLNYYLVPMVPILTPAVGESLRYADGTPITMTVRLASGEIRCQIVRAE